MKLDVTVPGDVIGWLSAANGPLKNRVLMLRQAQHERQTVSRQGFPLTLSPSASLRMHLSKHVLSKVEGHVLSKVEWRVESLFQQATKDVRRSGAGGVFRVGPKARKALDFGQPPVLQVVSSAFGGTMRRVAVHAIRSLCRTAVAVPASLLFAACLPDFRSPPIGEAKACLENMRVTAGALRDFVRVVHMERVGGRTKEAGGLETYELDWEAEVEGVRSFGSSLYVGFSELEKGERRVVTGTATFEKKPTGWICSTVDRIAVKAG